MSVMSKSNSSSAAHTQHRRRKWAITRLMDQPEMLESLSDLDSSCYVDPFMVDQHFNRLYEMSNV